jgi:hypothetical protein
MEHVYYMLAKKNLLPELPQELQDDPNYEIDYVGRLSLATKSFETMGAINTLRVFGELAQMNPAMMQSLQNVQPDKLFREIWYANSSSMNALKDPEEVLREREIQEQKVEQMREMQMMPAMADATQKLSGKVDPTSIIAQMEE